MPVRVEYHLTELGKSICPLLEQIYDWSWHAMKSRNMEIGPLGEIWHGYRERDEAMMSGSYKKK